MAVVTSPKSALVRPTHRLQHPALLTYVLGGAVGAGVNLSVTMGLYLGLGWDLLPAFFVGTVANEALHHIFYNVVYANRQAQLSSPLLAYIGSYWGFALTGCILVWGFGSLKFNPVLSVLLAIGVLSLFNTLLVRMSNFSSADLAAVEYREVDEAFYDDQLDSQAVGKFRAWYHKSRYRRLTELVQKSYRPGMAVADLGCGNCSWNVNHLPVVGVDINGKMLEWAARNGRLSEFQVVRDLSATQLPDSSFDLVVMSEVLEHMANPEEVLQEVTRIMRPGGRLTITVPYDAFLGPFFILFNLNCLYQGYVKRSRYHQYRCGHINHFTKSRLQALLHANGLVVEDLFLVNGLLIYAQARRA